MGGYSPCVFPYRDEFDHKFEVGGIVSRLVLERRKILIKV
jgi:hypothetical protein